MSIIYRKGVSEDIKPLLELIHELAVYEKAPGEVDNTVERMLEDGFGPDAVFGFYVAESDGVIIGASIYYYRYSTWKGRTLYLEDLIVTERYRGQGIGSRLFEITLDHARSKGCARLNWQVLDWNEPAIRFYKKYESNFDAEWLNGYINLKP